MNKMWKRCLAIMMALTMVFALTACGSKDDTATGGEATKAPEKKELVLWSIATKSDSFNKAYTKAIEDYQTAHPGVTIRHETFENEAYKTKIKTAVSSGELPDIFYTWGGGFSAPFIEAGAVLDIDSYFKDEFKSELPATALNNATYDGKLYGATYTTPISCLFYNKKMFDENGLTAPTTWDELKDVCTKLLAKGITPFGLSVKDTWVLAMCNDAFTLKTAGPAKTANTITKTEGSFNDADFVEAAKKLKELIDMGAFPKSATGLSNDEAASQFYKGKVGMYIMGSWMAGSILTDAKTPADFSVAPVPVFNDANVKITDFMGGAADTLMVAANSKNKDEAGNAVFELTKSISKYAYLDGAGIPAWKVDYDDKDVNPISKQVAGYAAEATSFTLWFDTLMQAEDAQVYLPLITDLYKGKVTPEDYAKKMAEQLEK